MESPLNKKQKYGADITQSDFGSTSDLNANIQEENAKIRATEAQSQLFSKDYISLIALKNKKQRFFLPSEENYFGGLKIEVVMVDSGCNSLLCPIVDEHALAKMAKLFPKTDYLWTIGHSQGVQSKSLTLLIKKKSEKRIALQLEKDLIKAKSKVPRLRFHLSKEDIRDPVLLENLIDPADVQLLKDATPTYYVQRRKHALVGQSLFKDHAVVQFGDMTIVVDTEKFPGFPIYVLQEDQQLLKQASKDRKPEKWDDLEDDDHDNDDVEYEPDLGESDFYD